MHRMGLIVIAFSTHSRPKAAEKWVQMTMFPNLAHFSTHSRPKAAEVRLSKTLMQSSFFNTQPPEGG